MKVDIEKLKLYIKNYLEDANVGSYEELGWGEDYSEDAENLDEILEKVENIVSNFNMNSEEKSIEDLLKNILDVEVIWDNEHSELENYYSFKNRFETLKDTIRWLDEKEFSQFIRDE